MITLCLIISEIVIKSMAISYVIYQDDNHHSMTLNLIMILHYLRSSFTLLTPSFGDYYYSMFQ